MREAGRRLGYRGQEDRVAVMGGRPPGIGEVIDIPLGRPRSALDTDTEVFLNARRRIRGLLRS